MELGNLKEASRKLSDDLLEDIAKDNIDCIWLEYIYTLKYTSLIQSQYFLYAIMNLDECVLFILFSLSLNVPFKCLL